MYLDINYFVVTKSYNYSISCKSSVNDDNDSDDGDDDIHHHHHHHDTDRCSPPFFSPSTHCRGTDVPHSF